MTRFTIIETPMLGDPATVLIYARWAIRDSINRDEFPLPALGALTGNEDRAEKAAFYLDRPMSDAMYDALEFYLKRGLPVAARWLEDHREVSADEAKGLAMMRVEQQRRIKIIADRVGVEVPWH